MNLQAFETCKAQGVHMQLVESRIVYAEKHTKRKRCTETSSASETLTYDCHTLFFNMHFLYYI